MKTKDIIKYCCGTDVNWAQQTNLCKKLLKSYTEQEIIYAKDYYTNQGIEVRSLGFLCYKDNMKDPVSLLRTEQAISKEIKNSGERNKRKVEQNNKTYGREKSYYCDFEES